MIANRSMPADVLVPVLAYPSVSEAAAWLIAGFGFTMRWQIGDHRAQLGVGSSAAIAVTAGTVPDGGGDHVMVRVDDLDSHRARAHAAGATVTEPASFPYGERQYTAIDPFGRRWAFSQSVADVDPADWGATVGPGLGGGR
jgi:uncharacterized glyoxalase superfamily protein PhnB